MKKFLKFFTSKFFFGALSIIVPIALLVLVWFWLDSLLTSLTEIPSNVITLGMLLTIYIIAAILCIRIVTKGDYPTYTIVWLLFIICIPPVGIFAYFFFGRNKIKKRLKKNYLLSSIDLKNVTDNTSYAEDIDLSTSREPSNVCALVASNNHPAFPATSTKYYGDISVLWSRLLTDLATATKFIYIEMFIIKSGEFWDSVKSVLLNKATSGVDVRITYDDFGTDFTKAEKDELISNGINLFCFNKIGVSFDASKNNRTHRKLIIIDGDVAYSGGFNIGDEYVGKKVRLGTWKDSGMRFEGPAVFSFTLMFLSFWQLQHKAPPLDTSIKYTPSATCEHPEARGLVQPLSSGPLGSNHRLIEQAFLQMITNAKKSIHVCTPYLTLSVEIESALTLAARRGVDVRIILPGIPDKKSVFEVSRAFSIDLIKSGVKVYEFSEGFLHSKEVIVDGRQAFIGTCNMDYRSFFLHFECGAILYETESIADMEAEFTKVRNRSRQITLAWAQELKWYQRVWRSILKILSPLF